MSQQVFWIAYAASNAVALLLLIAARYYPRLARFLYFLLFAWASWINTKTALYNPADYLNYSAYAVSFYRDFIDGWFAQHVTPMVLFIASGQALIALSMWAKGFLFRLGCIGGMLFLLGIAPLGVAAAFPFSLIAGAGLWVLMRRSGDRWLWER
ncbi:MAG: hypothetical protein R2791_22600 [Saprospiraceae bacterium]